MISVCSVCGSMIVKTKDGYIGCEHFAQKEKQK
jgi:hypothetical protein